MEDIYSLAERHRVTGDEAYTYALLMEDIRGFKADFPECLVFSIGKSLQGRDIIAIKIGHGAPGLFVCGAHHGMEWLTAKACVRFARELADFDGDAATACIIPMVNPDGVELAASGLKWQANARGVDLNHNYDALWSLSQRTAEGLGICSPCASGFGGAHPESEPETRAVASFIRENSFDAVAALHSQGEVIYYDFCGIVPDGTNEYLQGFEAVSDYVRDIPSGTAVCGGFKDWFIRKYRKPGFTIEIGRGENPLPLSQFDEVYCGVRGILFELVRKG